MSSSEPEGSLQALRRSLQEAERRDATAKAALAKSDAVILELRSSVRQLKRQAEGLLQTRNDSEARAEALQRELVNLQQSADMTLQREQETHRSRVQRLESELIVTNSQAKDQVVGELQVQLDRAHAQILTADMVRKELEDTLEAEQYTWELRVQDQERQLLQLQQECKTLRDDLEECRAQWKEAEVGWTKEVKDLQKDLDAAHQELVATRSTNGTATNVQEKMRTLERERRELQQCLDEAMRELEAVDAELRRDPTVVEPLQQLYRWLMQRNDMDENTPVPKETGKLLDGIQDMIEASPNRGPATAAGAATGKGVGARMAGPPSPNGNESLRIAELEAQISVYRGDLKAREESASELRVSLKEAVALLKPLQDAVAKTNVEKQALEAEVEQLKMQSTGHGSQEIERLRQEVKALQDQMANRGSPRRSMMQSSNEEGHVQQKESARAKRNAELALKKMLGDAQSRFQELHQTNHEIVRENQELHSKLQEVEKTGMTPPRNDEDNQRDIAFEMREATIAQLEKELDEFRGEVGKKETEISDLQEELDRSKRAAPALAVEYRKMQAELHDLRQQAEDTERLEAQLAAKEKQLQMRADSEQILNDSLVEALNLLKPLQAHLQTAEKEKRDLAKQVKSYKKKLARLSDPNISSSSSKSPTVGDSSSAWESTVQELEAVNARMQPQREKLKTDLLEMQSQYERTQEKLVSAQVENHVLVDALQHKEQSEQELMNEVRMVKAKLETADRELDNAKYIATSALVKVEELTMANVQRPAHTHRRTAASSVSPPPRRIEHVSNPQPSPPPSSSPPPAEMHQVRQRVQRLESNMGSSSRMDRNDF